MEKKGINAFSISEGKTVDARWAVETFDQGDNRYEGEKTRISNDKLRSSFVDDYPIDKIKGMTLDQYCKGEKSFSFRLRRELQCLASMGNAWPDTFGIYINKSTNEICLSKTYKKLYGNNYMGAFKCIKSDIVDLLSDFKTKSFDVTVGSRLNKMLVYKLLLVYYPNDTFPVCAKTTVKKYCDYFSLPCSDRDEIYVGIKTILDWKNKCSCFSAWSYQKMMWFLGWLITSNYKIVGSTLVDEKENDINRRKKAERNTHDISIKPIFKKDIDLSEQQEWREQTSLYSTLLIRDTIDTEYSAVPESRKTPQTDGKSGSLIYPRDSRRKISALKRAGFVCEYDSTHVSFISRSTGKPYMEPHHLIPLEYWASFENDIDVEANIVCLCSNCHNEIHYGVESERIVKALYEKRKKELCSAGLEISFEVLMKMYDGSYVTEECKGD